MKKSAWILCMGWLLTAPLPGMPRIIKEVLETNTAYRSWAAAPAAWSGQGWIISNHISRHGYNVAGKIVKIYAEPEDAGLFRVVGSAPVSPEEEEAEFWETGDRPGPDRLAERERDEKKKRDTPWTEGPAVQGKTDMFGRVSFLFVPSVRFQGRADVRVCFVNQSTGFSEHVVLHRLEVRSRASFILETTLLAVLLTALAIASVLAARAVWRPEPPVVALLLFPWLSAWGGKPVSAGTLRRWAILFTLDGLAIAVGNSVFPGMGWAILSAVPLLILFRRTAERLGTGSVLLMALFLAQSVLAIWMAHWGGADLLGPLVRESYGGWILGPLVAILFPNPALAFPVLGWLLGSGLLDAGRALVSLPVFFAAYGLLEWRKGER